MATQTGLVKQQVSISLTGGIDRKTDPKQLSNGQMYTADNVQYVTEKQCRKRFGYTTLTPPGGLQGAPFASVGCRDNVEPIVLGTGYLNRYNTQTGLSTTLPANTQGRLSAANITASSGIGVAPSAPVNSSCATDGEKYVLVTWEEIDGANGILFYGIQDLTTGSWIISPVQIPQATTGTFVGGDGVTYTATAQFSPRAFYNSGYFYILLEFAGKATVNSTTIYGASIQAYAINLLNLSAGILTTNLIVKLVANSSTVQAANAPNYGWDAALSNGNLYVAYTNPNTPGAGYIQQFTVNAQTFTSVNTGVFTSATPADGTYRRVSIAVGSNASVPLAITTGTSTFTFTSNLTQSTRVDFTNPTKDVNSYPTASLCVGNVYYGFAMTTAAGGSALYVSVIGINATTGATVFSGNFPPPSTTVAAGIVARPWAYNGKIYIWILGSGYAGWGVYREQILLEINMTTLALNYVARTAYQVAGLTNQPYNMVPSDTINIPNTNQYVAYLTQTTDVVGGTPPTLGTAATVAIPAVIANQFYGVLTRTQFDFTPSTPNAMYNLPTGGVFIAGAIPQQYDGQALVEAGFSSAPELTTAPNLPGNGVTPINSSSGTGRIPAGVFTYYLVFCRRDAYGNVIRSSPSSPYQVTLTGTQNSVSFPGIYYSRVPGTYLELYRTTVASPSQPQLAAKIPNGQAYIDGLADSAIVSNPTLYTYAGEYPNDPPPAVHSMAIGEARAYIIPSDNRNSVWCSKKFSPGRSTEWTSNLILSEGGTHSGQFTAIAVLDTNVIVFKKDQILYFYGDGPDNAGATGSFSAFQRLSSDVGCIDPGSLAIVPGGLLFRSQRGIEVLTRGLQVQYIGAPVEPIVQGIQSISSTCVLPQYQQVRFVSSVAGDPVLVFDYINNRWSTYSNMSALSCANVMGNYWWISQDGSTCNVETPNAFTDNGAFIPMTLETPEIPMTGIQGWGRLYRMSVLGEYKSPHTLLTSFAYDHAETYNDIVSYSVADTQSVSNTPPDAVLYDSANRKIDIVRAPCAEQFRMSRVPRQVMQTVRIMLQDTPYNGYYVSDGAQISYTFPAGEGCAISNITLEVGQKAILAKLPGSKTV